MFQFLKKKTEFKPTKKILEAAIIKGKRIGLNRNEIIEMASLLDKSKTKNKIEKIVNEILS